MQTAQLGNGSRALILDRFQPAARVLAGGLQVVDAKLGEGPGAKNGTKIGMRYIGKLENGKVSPCAIPEMVPS